MGRKNSKKWAGYKGHLVVEEESEIITAIETTPANQADGSQLKPLLRQQEDAHDLKPQELSGDKAYDSGANLEHLESKGITGNISVIEKFNRRGPDLFSHDDFKYDAQHGTLTCPAGCVASHSRRDLVLTEETQRKGILFQFSRRQCHPCELRALCFTHTSKIHGRAVHISVYEPLFQQMKDRMDSEAGREAYSKRYKVEHKVADLARYCGMRRSRYRGIARVKIHNLLAALASNVKRMARLLWPVHRPDPPGVAAMA